MRIEFEVEKITEKSYLANIGIPDTGLIGKRWLAKSQLNDMKNATPGMCEAEISEWYAERLAEAEDVQPLPVKQKREVEYNHKILFMPEAETDKSYRAEFEIPEMNFKNKTWLAKAQLKNLNEAKTPHEAFISDWYMGIITTTSAERKAKK